MKYCLDANVFITAWHVHYPIEVPEFREFWNNLVALKDGGKIIIIKPIFDELVKEPLLREWLENKRFKETNIHPADEKLALYLRKEYQCKTSARGVSINDTILVAYACRKEYTVVTYEAKQPNYNEKPWNKKIPSVCNEQGVRCITFIEMLKEAENDRQQASQSKRR